MKVNKVFWGNTSLLRGHVCFILILRGRRADFKAHAMHTSAQAAHNQFTLESHLKRLWTRHTEIPFWFQWILTAKSAHKAKSP